MVDFPTRGNSHETQHTNFPSDRKILIIQIILIDKNI